MSRSEIDKALETTLPGSAAIPMLDDFESMLRNFFLRKYDFVLVAAGRMVENLFRCLSYLCSDEIPVSPNFSNIIRILSEVPEDQLPSSIKIIIPRAGKCLYDLRSKRGAVHTNAGVSPSYMDAVFAVSIAQWIIAELVRIYSKQSPEIVTTLVNSLVDRKLPIVEEIQGIPVILEVDLSAHQSMLIILYHYYPNPVETDRLIQLLPDFTHSNIVTSLRNAEKSKLIFRKGKENFLTAKGISYVEDKYGRRFFRGDKTR